MLDDVSDDDDDSPPESKRQRKVSFVDDVVDNERQRETSTLAAALQPHFTIDNENKVNMEGTNPSNCRIAFPNQTGPCYKPPYQVLEKWLPSPDFKNFVVNGIGAFSNELHLLKKKEETRIKLHFADIQSKPPEHLIIFDSMLTGIPFKKTYKRLETIKCAWPNNPFQIIKHMKSEIAEKRNDYVMKNIFICFGLDFILYERDLKRARRNTVQFFEQFLNVIISAFNPKGPKRYKADEDKSIIDAFPPKLIFITVPQVVCSNPYVTTLNHEIAKINDDIRKFVKECKEKAQQKRVFMEIYDWGKACSSYNQCNVADLSKRNDTFMNHLSNEYAILMYTKQEAP
uniref:Uncharacterized protein n=1 Tax=Panagrolaimus sp. PS1159 TaxID=55785 RepID=A0AC35EUX9_9BILA